ncbi:hypothetical protein POTOM_040944 [Populus tomentosa]|uniref:ABC transporter domain-containing protein n=1 Tax=Populus tomentosa TaxID=118781 RepID=A0A8X7YPZ1_POPTO|nr:hypothetical protein POTOM_040944 [Populus tomentosa]
MSLSPPTIIGSTQFAGSNGCGHSMDFMSQAYLRKRYSKIDIEEDSLNMNKDGPLPIFLKFEYVECKVRNSKASSANLVKAMASKRRIGFETQDDVLLPQLTVDETLIAAFLRLPGNISRQQRYARVEMIIKELGLERVFIKGISGGERKRTSIGYEILVDPSLLLLDEPTSGLDSTSANRLFQVLQGLAKVSK